MFPGPKQFWLNPFQSRSIGIAGATGQGLAIDVDGM
jgi:hypothetical protein